MAWNPTYKVDTRTVLDKAYGDGALKEKLREFISDETFTKLFGQRIVDEIVTRTEDKMIDRKGDSLGTYSKVYKESLVFQIYKGGETRVDLRLTGEMLESLKATANKFQIVVDLDGEVNKGKAQGHITGKLGKHGKAPKRDFLGLPEAELTRIFKESMKDFRSGKTTEVDV